MTIDSRVQDIARELQMVERASIAAGRQKSVVSDPSGDSTREPNLSTAQKSVTEARDAKALELSIIDVRAAVEKLNKFAEAQMRDVSFSIDEDTDTTVIKILKRKTGEVIKQYPCEEILALKARLRNTIGWLFDSKV